MLTPLASQAKIKNLFYQVKSLEHHITSAHNLFRDLHRSYVADTIKVIHQSLTKNSILQLKVLNGTLTKSTFFLPVVQALGSKITSMKLSSCYGQVSSMNEHSPERCRPFYTWSPTSQPGRGWKESQGHLGTYPWHCQSIPLNFDDMPTFKVLDFGKLLYTSTKITTRSLTKKCTKV